MPYSIRILLENALRSCDNAKVPEKDVETILSWGMYFATSFIAHVKIPNLVEKTSKEDVEIRFKPSRVLLQDFTGVPAVVDLGTFSISFHH